MGSFCPKNANQTQVTDEAEEQKELKFLPHEVGRKEPLKPWQTDMISQAAADVWKGALTVKDLAKLVGATERQVRGRVYEEGLENWQREALCQAVPEIEDGHLMIEDLARVVDVPESVLRAIMEDSDESEELFTSSSEELELKKPKETKLPRRNPTVSF